MKKWLVFSLLCVVLATVCGGYPPVQAQTGGPKPTFISPTSGLYVNGWPPFTVSYPKEWVEQPLIPGEIFRAGLPRPPQRPSPAIALAAVPFPADMSASIGGFAGWLGQVGYKEIKVLYNKPATLQDGTPAQEAEIEFLPPNGPPKWNLFELAAKKDGILIMVHVIHDEGMVGENLKSVAYSLKVPQGKPEPVKVPPDIQALLDSHCKAVDAGDVAKIMANYSDRFLNNGTKKVAEEQWYGKSPFSPIKAGVASSEITVTLFEPQGDRAYLAGFVAHTLKAGPPGATPFPLQHLIKEEGQWKWYGNQK